jgi:aminoglycoside/choline kinase family phosphotransferase
MQLMPVWFLHQHLGLEVGASGRALLDRVFDTLADSALDQPRAFVHRDYHSRNLLVCEDANPGILDFQDAVYGPVTYDAASLLKDCYIAWPPVRVRGWLLEYRAKLMQAGVAIPGDAETFVRWFDLMGLQRHIKVLGIFSRLYHRDGKPGYLKDLPRVLDYVRAAASAYSETREFAAFVTDCIDPAFARVRADAGT